MVKEFNLRERRQDEYGDYCYKEDDVKEFIKRLKEGTNKQGFVKYILIKDLDKLAGDKLIIN